MKARPPLVRLLAVNLLGGAAAAALMLAGLLALNPQGLRDLILADSGGGVALVMLGCGLLITFGSAAMGTAIMMLGKRRAGSPPRGRAHVAARVRTSRRIAGVE